MDSSLMGKVDEKLTVDCRHMGIFSGVGGIIWRPVYFCLHGQAKS
jgi:hypothetical protein